ncbi:MAG: T9SS type A sorting domain-containing protein [Bacteroidetes bacterium]|nr:T9SS type A sorting domain-containing protein [Bacteroidota bacterium]
MKKHIPHLASFLILISCILPGYGQSSFTGTMKYTWAGGLNACQFCSIDLNLDGLNDLLIFDRHGNRKLTFINQGGVGQVNYRYAPEYEALLPEMQEWVITADYNCDGKMDIFTYGYGGVRVFRNTSAGSLSFHLQTDLLKSWYYTGYVGILVTSADYPAIADIDGDGDLDLLTFFGLGSYMEYHKNLSMEKFGNCDSLDYRLTDHCWGKFKESEGGNRITLNAVCPYKSSDDLVTADGLGPPKHTGSTLLANDLNGDGLTDLIIGDVDFPNLIALINGGTRDSALMVSQDSLFPFYDRSIKLFSFPALSWLDLDNDGIKDLVVSPFDPSYYNAENTKSCWFYKNTGSNTNPHFVFQTENLFQSEMLDFGSGSNPVCADLNGDGLQDIISGNYGYYDSSAYHSGYLQSYYTSSLAWLKNTGSIESPSFELVTTDLANASRLKVHGLYPAFYDLNNDGILDLLCGDEDGSLIFFQGRGDSAGIPVYGSPQKNYQQIKTDAFSAPQLFDLDRDGLADLVIGRQNGTMVYYRNTGSPGNPVFTLGHDSLGKIDVTNHNLSYFGYCTPFFFRNKNRTYLLAGSEEGKMHLFSGIDGNLNGRFTEIDSVNILIGISGDSLRIGWRASGFLSHLSDPQYYDMVCGNFSGGLNYFTKGRTPGIQEPKPDEPALCLKIFPDPADMEITISIDKNRSGRFEPSGGNPEPCLLRIFNSIGRELIQKNYIPGSPIATAALPQGMYIAVLSFPVSSKEVRGKFLITRTAKP